MVAEADLLGRVEAGDLWALSRLCRRVEEGLCSQETLRALHDRARRCRFIGVTGSPGAGKSTLVSRLITEERRRGVRVGVVAVDPTSPFTGGAVLGDRIRMQEHGEDPEVFVRSLATRGERGGLSRATWDTALLLAAWGASVVLIETVGVGQAELDVLLVADTVVVVVAPGMGDDVQAAKAGILEIGDVLVVNKSDRPDAARTLADLQGMLALSRVSASSSEVGGHAAHPPLAARVASASSWPELLAASAESGAGVEGVCAALDRHAAWLETPDGAARRAARQERLLSERLADQVVVAFEARGTTLRHLAAAVARGERTYDDILAEIERRFCKP